MMSTVLRLETGRVWSFCLSIVSFRVDDFAKNTYQLLFFA
jgi:hypothetical protein